jgi:hypothetical protein
VLTCHRVDVQARLPQFFVGNEHVFPKGELEAAILNKPDTVHFWREKSGWCTVELMCRVLVLIAKVLREFTDVQPIILWDAAAVHVHRQVLWQAVQLKLWLCCIPAGTTFVLQPLDTHCFAAYKRYLRNGWRRLLGQRSHVS